MCLLTIVQDDHERSEQVTHALNVAHLQMLPHVAADQTHKHIQHVTPCLESIIILSNKYKFNSVRLKFLLKIQDSLCVGFFLLTVV